MKTIRFFVREYALSGVFMLILLGVWEILVHVFEIAPYILPPPSKIFIKLFTNYRLLLSHGSVTLVAVIGGFLLGATAGTTCAIAMARSRLIERMLYPLVISSQTFPKEALAPIFVIWFGFGCR